MTDTIPVVKEATLLDEAYNMGFRRFDGAESSDPESLSHFKESAQFINSVAPSIRAMCGFSDSKGGTYQVRPDKMAVIPVGSGDDEPATAELIEPQYVHDAAMDAFDAGAYDAIEGNERGESDDIQLTQR